MSSALLKSLLGGDKVEIYDVPESLQRYIQDKARSSYHHLAFIPLAFPVFVMNPFPYAENWKGQLLELVPTTNATLISTDPVPSGEVWEVTNAFGFDLGSAKALALIGGGAYLKYTASGVFLEWNGTLILTEGQTVDFSGAAASNKWLHVIGVKRYA